MQSLHFNQGKRTFLTHSRPVNCMESYDESDMEEIERRKKAQCIRIMLEAGADVSLEMDHGNGLRETGFMDAVEDRSLVNVPLRSQP